MNNEWISIKERLPENESLVLLYSNNTIWLVRRLNAYWIDDRASTAIKTNEYWMPLPEPPNSDNNTDTFSEVSGKVIVGM